MAFSTYALFVLLLSGSALLQYASVVESNFLLLAFVLVLAVTLWHLSTSRMAMQHERSFRANGDTSLPSSVYQQQPVAVFSAMYGFFNSAQMTFFSYKSFDWPGPLWPLGKRNAKWKKNGLSEECSIPQIFQAKLESHRTMRPSQHTTVQVYKYLGTGCGIKLP
jgi:hypothetical protein